jgi:hypothetical protein
MAALNTACGWVITDPSNILVALGVNVSRYTISQITDCMNDICDYAPHMVIQIQDLVMQYATAQLKMIELNNTSNGKTLIKADVLEWAPDKTGTSYSPEREVLRIREQLILFFGGCPICDLMDHDNGSIPIYRS